MSAKAGEIAREDAVYRCEECDRTMRVRMGFPIEDCPGCGCASFFTGVMKQAQPVDAALNGVA